MVVSVDLFKNKILGSNVLILKKIRAFTSYPELIEGYKTARLPWLNRLTIHGYITANQYFQTFSITKGC
jgi:hypothetical protein